MCAALYETDTLLNADDDWSRRETAPMRPSLKTQEERWLALADKRQRRVDAMIDGDRPITRDIARLYRLALLARGEAARCAAKREQRRKARLARQRALEAQALQG